MNDTLCVKNAVYEEVADGVYGKVDIAYLGEEKRVETEGKGRLDCIANAIRAVTGREYVLESDVEHALEEKSTSKAASYVSVVENGRTYWGVGIHSDIMTSSIMALVSAVNRMLKD